MAHTLCGTFKLLYGSNGTSPYVGVVLHDDPLLQTCWQHLARLGLDEAIETRHARDGKGHAHVTFAATPEWGGLVKHHPERAQTLQALFGQHVVMELHGIGLATSPSSGNQAWFGIVSSGALDELRASLGMRAKEFHVTLAFLPKDVFDAPKGMESMIASIEEVLHHNTGPYESMGPQ